MKKMETYKTKENQNVDIRLAVIDDLKYIKSLNEEWTVTSLDIREKEYGFLFCKNYSSRDLEKILLAEETAVAIHNNEIIGYYINDNHSQLLSEYKDAIKQLKNQNAVHPKSRVSLRTQIVIQQAYQRLGIPSAMLSFLKPYLLPKFDILFSIGINENPKKVAHQKAGWKIIYEDLFKYYCIYDLTE